MHLFCSIGMCNCMSGVPSQNLTGRRFDSWSDAWYLMYMLLCSYVSYVTTVWWVPTGLSQKGTKVVYKELINLTITLQNHVYTQLIMTLRWGNLKLIRPCKVDLLVYKNNLPHTFSCSRRKNKIIRKQWFYFSVQ